MSQSSRESMSPRQKGSSSGDSPSHNHNNHINTIDNLELGLGKFNRPNDNELRILIFTATYFVLDGVTLTIRRIESHLRAQGATVKILSTVPDDCTPEQVKDIIVVPGIKIPFTHAGSGYAFGVGLDENTLRLIDEYNPNCIHFTVPDFVALDGIRYCQRKNIAYIGTWHSNYVDYLKYYFIEWILGPAFHRYLIGFFEQIPVTYIPTPYMMRRVQDWGYGRCTQLKEWGRGIDTKLFNPARRSSEFRAAKGFAENEIVLLWVGRIVPEKRPDIFLNVVKRLQNEGLPVRACIVGNGTFEKTLSSVRGIVCLGWLSGTALAEAYASADILLFPSDVETFGNVTLEALASGCVCVVEEKCGGHLVEHGINGFSCPAGNFESFYQHTKNLCQDDLMRVKMSQHARESAWKFERGKILQQMNDNYKDAIVRHRDPSFITKFMTSNPEAQGKNFLSLICCNYWFVKTFAEPFLNTSLGVQNVVHGSAECISRSRSRLNCSESYNRLESELNRYKDESKRREKIQSSTFLSSVHCIALSFSYAIILTFIVAVFTIRD